MADGERLVRIGQLARDAGVGKATIEHYLRLGLLRPARTEGQGYRLFERDSVARIDLIRRARRSGFGLPEVRAMLDAVPVPELDLLLASLAPLRCRRELRARGVSVGPEEAS